MDDMTNQDKWTALVGCAEILTDAADRLGDGTGAEIAVRSLTELVAALVALLMKQGVPPPDVAYFCICDDEDEPPAVCVIHLALAFRQSSSTPA
jgi:hypothetical protein